MRTYPSHDDCRIYPGGYVPRQVTDRKLSILRSSKNKIESELQVSLKEFPDAFKLEISLPGVERDEIILRVDDRTLTIDLATRDFGRERHIPLPELADMEFVSAELRKGVLALCIPKAVIRVGPVSRQIIVY